MATPLVVRKPGLFAGFDRVNVTTGGEPFYYFERPGAIAFTLPAGRYEAHTPVHYVEPMPRLDVGRMPRPRLRIPRIRIVWCDNPSTCSIDLRRGLIMADRSLKELPPFVRRYVFLHEIGHYWNFGAETPEGKAAQEHACDAYAAAQMLRLGYNPSQIAIASQMSLSECSAPRKAAMWNLMRKA